MIEINLLPKEMRRPTGLGIPKSVLIGAAGAAAVLVLLVAVTAFQAYRVHNINGKIADVRRQADRMKDDIVLVDRLVDVKSKILSRLAAIEKLDRDRERWVRVLDELADRVPDFLWLTAFGPPGSTGKTGKAGISSPTAAAASDSTTDLASMMQIEGFSFTLNGLANFLLELDCSDYFADMQLDFAKLIEVDEHRAYNFSLRCRLQEPVGLDEARDVENVGQNKADENVTSPDETSALDDEQEY